MGRKFVIGVIGCCALVGVAAFVIKKVQKENNVCMNKNLNDDQTSGSIVHTKSTKDEAGTITEAYAKHKIDIAQNISSRHENVNNELHQMEDVVYSKDRIKEEKNNAISEMLSDLDELNNEG